MGERTTYTAEYKSKIVIEILGDCKSRNNNVLEKK